MKTLNIFKTETKNIAKSNIQPLEKNQLSKVIGGAEADKTGTGEEVNIKPIRLELK